MHKTQESLKAVNIHIVTSLNNIKVIYANINSEQRLSHLIHKTTLNTKNLKTS